MKLFIITYTMSGKHCRNYDIKQETVTHKMLTAAACDKSVQLKVVQWCCWNLRVLFKICFCFVLLYNYEITQ